MLLLITGKKNLKSSEGQVLWNNYGVTERLFAVRQSCPCISSPETYHFLQVCVYPCGCRTLRFYSNSAAKKCVCCCCCCCCRHRALILYASPAQAAHKCWQRDQTHGVSRSHYRTHSCLMPSAFHLLNTILHSQWFRIRGELQGEANKKNDYWVKIP